MYVCSCFGITEQQVRQHAETGACTPRQIAGACKAGTDCGSCVRKIQALLGRGACPRREALDPVVLTTAAATASAATAVAAASVPAPTAAEAA
ncbi:MULTISPECIES: (2Fe-2S)-binding protein [Streptomyces]|uniref:Bacterioferritin-associated ferredoxin n=1 Tax=Streptomyces melanosporofaciens TaxID=67327 RepID=A0A1H4LWK7_STRMJ|nr:(2Fe-2S)-binding protein [Streptomyces melanosporofaciens]SEB74957.1 Bacterioferritin-associated ferredoxin [Streptomyces melanosporofaciens]